jgi:tetratricopeptide (TPR) repeat protein
MRAHDLHSIPREAIEAAIAHVDARIAIDMANATLHFDRAQFLEFLGRTDEALAAYTAALELAPEDSQTLNAVGLALLSRGERELARSLFRSAIVHDPQHAAAHANLAFIEMSDGNAQSARTLYELALGYDPSLAIAHHGMADIAERLGDAAEAARHRSLGLRLRPMTIGRYTGTGNPVRILALGTAAFGNIATTDFFDPSLFSVASVVVDYLDDTVPLPPHDLIFNIIGEADRCADQLALAARIIERSDAPVLNHPSVVSETTREMNARRLRDIEGVVAPRISRIDRATLRSQAAAALLEADGFVFPLLLRSPGYHTGEHFIKVESAGDVVAAVDALPGDELLVIEYLDSTDSLGNARKYRVMIVDGVIYPLHLAISRDWKVHYFSADMAEQAVNRAEDEAFLIDMAGTLGEPAMTAIARIRDALQLDYGGIDFGRDSRGSVVVYEANASMIVPTPDADPKWDYRRRPVALIQAAVRRMFIARARIVVGR